ncbi:ABC transporter permease [Primorskyibacter sp. S87]|uniref:ABC transporter permease n=1 Tax=Primorskyibacter sp. S87 TaxID=3415126 RepID=UPI003C7C82FA
MKPLLFLAWRNLSHHKIRSLVLVLVLTIVTSIPVLANLVVARAEQDLTSRAASTPLVYGAQGSEIDLVLSAAYFSGVAGNSVPMSDYTTMIDLALYDLVPLRISASSRGYPVVGIDYEYFRVRGLSTKSGKFPLRIGEAILGAAVAKRLGLKQGDTIWTDATQSFDLSGAYPVALTVSGILAATGTPDDRVVFVDLSTAWIAEGIGHGHQKLDPDRDQNLLLKSKDGDVVANASLRTFTEVTDENRERFHYHGEESDLPISAILVFPRSDKAAALLKGRVVDQAETRQIVQVDEVVEQLLTRVFQMKTVLQNVVAAMAVAALLALLLVIVLSVRMRQREFEIANQIGAPRRHAVWLVAVELVLVLFVALILTGLVAGGIYLATPQSLQGWLIGGQGA